MPYMLVGNCLHKKNPDGKAGDKIGCHGTRKEALAQMRALYANEGESKEIEAIDKEMGEEQSRAFLASVGEVMGNAEWGLNEKAAAVKELAEELVSETVVPEPTLSLDEEKPPVPSGDEPASHKAFSLDEVVSTVVEKVKDLLGLSKVDKSGDGFMAYKEVDGTYKWVTRYSNHFRDQDNPPEIIASDSHKSFVEKVEKGLAPLPELWIWHVKEWRIGMADWVAYDPDSGFAIAGGHSLPGTELVYEAMSNVKGMKVSHGMPKSTLVYDDKDKSIIVEHETREISPLPGWAAANKLTGFVVLDTDNVKEADMAIPADKREKLIKEWGISEDILTKIEQANQADSQKALDEGLEHKEAPTEPAIAAATVAESTETKDPVVAETPSAEAKEAPPAAPEPVVDPLAELKEMLVSMQAQITALKETKVSEQEAVNKAVSMSPAASILSMFAPAVKSAIGSDATQVDGRTSIAKSKPVEAVNVEGRTLVPFINEILAGKTGQQS